MPSSPDNQVFRTELVDGVLIVMPQGDSLEFRHNDIHFAVNSVSGRLRSSEHRGLVIDFGDREIVSSIMIGATVRIARQYRSQRGAVAFCGTSASIREVYQGMNLTKLWTYFDSRAEAVASVTDVSD